MTIVGNVMMVVVAFHFFYVRFSTGLRFAPNLWTKVWAGRRTEMIHFFQYCSSIARVCGNGRNSINNLFQIDVFAVRYKGHYWVPRTAKTSIWNKLLLELRRLKWPLSASSFGFCCFPFFYVRCSSGLRGAPNLRMKVWVGWRPELFNEFQANYDIGHVSLPFLRQPTRSYQNMKPTVVFPLKGEHQIRASAVRQNSFYSRSLVDSGASSRSSPKSWNFRSS